MLIEKQRIRKPRFGILVDAKYKDPLTELAERTHRTPPRYVEMLLERHFLELEKASENGG